MHDLNAVDVHVHAGVIIYSGLLDSCSVVCAFAMLLHFDPHCVRHIWYISRTPLRKWYYYCDLFPVSTVLGMCIY